MPDPAVTDEVAVARARSPHSRAGNAMDRTRLAAFEGARRVLAERGLRKATMGDVAVRGGLAKATLYNHFRTKDALVAALVATEVDALVAAATARSDDLAVALAGAADALATHAVLTGVREVEPLSLAVLAGPGEGPGWDHARAGVADVLAASHRPVSPAAVDTVLRWLCTFVSAPAEPDTRSAGAVLIVSGLPAARPTTVFADASAPRHH